MGMVAKSLYQHTGWQKHPELGHHQHHHMAGSVLAVWGMDICVVCQVGIEMSTAVLDTSYTPATGTWPRLSWYTDGLEPEQAELSCDKIRAEASFGGTDRKTHDRTF